MREVDSCIELRPRPYGFRVGKEWWASPLTREFLYGATSVKNSVFYASFTRAGFLKGLWSKCKSAWNAVLRIWHVQDIQGQILALALQAKVLIFFGVCSLLGSGHVLKCILAKMAIRVKRHSLLNQLGSPRGSCLNTNARARVQARNRILARMRFRTLMLTMDHDPFVKSQIASIQLLCGANKVTVLNR